MDLANHLTFPQWQLAHFDSTNSPTSSPGADPDGDGAANQLEYFTGTDPNNGADTWNIGIARSGGGVSLTYTQAPNYRFEVQWSTNLVSTSFWRFLDVPENRPSYPPQPQVHTVPDTIQAAPLKAYRVRISEP